MNRVARICLLSLVACFVVGLVWFVCSDAQARPLYCKTFIEQYPKVEAAKDAKCGICHPGKEKTERNNYGQALCKTIGENEKDAAKVKAALTKTEAEKSAVEGKTFGDLLKDGKLPAWK